MKLLCLILAILTSFVTALAVVIGLIYLDPLTVLYTSAIWLIGLPLTIFLFAFAYTNVDFKSTDE